MKTAITINQARAELEHRNNLTSSQKGYTMNQLVEMISKSVIVVSGIALTSVLGACGQVPQVAAPVVQAVQTQSQSQSQSQTLSQTSFTPANLSDGLVGYWTFDENGTAKYDHTANRNTMSFNGTSSPDVATAPVGFENPFSLVLKATPGGFGTAPGKGIDPLQTLTMSFWVRFPAHSLYSGTHSLVTINNKAQITSTYNGSSNKLSLNLSGDTAIRDFALPDDGAYHQILATRDSHSLRLYVDGYGTETKSTGGTINPGQGVTVGDTHLQYYVNIDDLRIYNRAFSPEQVQDWFICGREPDVTAPECHALVATFNGLKSSMASSPNANAMLRSGWGTTNKPCTWYGVVCIDDHVNGLAMPESRLAHINGESFPHELSDLTQLQNLDLRNNSFAEPLSEQLGMLPNLKVMALSGNKFSGPIPDSFSQLSNLVTLDLSKNALSGPIPNGLGQATNLENLDLSGNQLSDGIPYGLTTLPKLTKLNLQNNQLRGPIPTRLSTLSFLTTMNLGYNMLSSSDTNLLAFLKTRAPGWETTQTVPVGNVQAKVLSDTSATLTWTPVAYSADGGYYDILSMPAGGNLFKSVGHTTNKSSSSFTVTGLTGKRYSFVIRTFTPKHTDQQNDLSSDSTNPVTVTMTGNHAPVAAADNYSTVMNTVLTVNAARGLFANDSDSDGNVFRLASINTAVAGSKLALNPDGSFSFTPPVGFVGTVVFTYQITDGSLLSSPATISFRVMAPAPGTVGVIVYHDLITNGTWDVNESILPGWTITAKNNQTGQTQTLLSGASLMPARFNNLMPGSYTICETVKPGWTSLSGESSAGCYTRNVISGQSVLLWFGNIVTN